MSFGKPGRNKEVAAMTVQLTGRKVLELFCTAREAERSVDFALLAEWPDFLEYYSAEKVARVVGLVERLRDLLPAEMQDVAARSREEICRRVLGPGPVRLLFGRWLARIQKTWGCRAQEIVFGIATLERLLQALKSTDRPSQDALIALRMDMYTCEYVIECRCHGLPGLA